MADERTATAIMCLDGERSPRPAAIAFSASASASCRYASSTSACSASGSVASVIQPRMASPVRRSACDAMRASRVR